MNKINENYKFHKSSLFLIYSILKTICHVKIDNTCYDAIGAMLPRVRITWV